MGDLCARKRLGKPCSIFQSNGLSGVCFGSKGIGLFFLKLPDECGDEERVNDNEPNDGIIERDE